MLSALGMKVSLAISNAAQLLPFDDLEGTIVEAQEIRQVADTTDIAGSAATKQALKTMPVPHVLHIASHAYTFGLDDGASKDIGVMPWGHNPLHERMGFTDNAISDPYLRTGLALAGANWRMFLMQPGDSCGDGVLTAQEVLQMDLSATRLVVLSACETAAGEAQSGRSVASLTEAFLLAGADAIVASLWPLPDAEAALFMRDFYKALADGMDIGDALHTAKTEARKNAPQDVAVWANYQCFGDPRTRVHLH